MKRVTILLSLVVFFAVSCTKIDSEIQVPNVSSTPCKQEVLKSSGLSDNVDLEFTNEGVHITHYNFEVPCDFTTVNVTHTFVNGVLNITQQGSPNQANCVCYTDVSYTIEKISQNEVNVIFINGEQVYCYNDNQNELSLHVKVENAAEFSEVVEIKLVVYYSGEPIELARGNWKNGGFSIIFPETVNPNYLCALINNCGLPTTLINASSTASISNPNAKINDAHFWGMDKDGEVVCTFDMFEIDENGNTITTYNHDLCYRYVDSDVTISGYAVHTYGIHSVHYTFSIEWKKGWNVLWRKSGVAESGLPEVRWTTIPTSRVKWYGSKVYPPIIIY